MPDFDLGRIKSSPYWYIVWCEGRRTRRRSTRETDYQRARLVLSAFLLEKDRKPESTPDELTVAAVLEDYYRDRAAKLASAEQARIAKAHLIRFFGLGKVSAITNDAHERYEAARRGAGTSAATINRERMVLRAALNHARKLGRLTAVPHVPALREDSQAPKGRPLTLDELAELLRHATAPHERRFLMMLVGTLCRPDAAFEFDVTKQADFEHGLILLNPPGRVQTKKNRPTVPMPRFMRAEMAAFLKGRTKEDPGNFIAYHGKPIRSAKTAFRRMRKDAGFDGSVNPYSVRHTMARELRRRRVPSDQIGIMLGHRPLTVKRTDLIYAPFEPGYCQEAKRAIDSVWRAIARKARASPGVDKSDAGAGKARKGRYNRHK